MVHNWNLEKPGQVIKPDNELHEAVIGGLDDWLIDYLPLPYSLSHEGINVDIIEPRAFYPEYTLTEGSDVGILSSYDVFFINLQPYMAKRCNEILSEIHKKTKVVVRESQPYPSLPPNSCCFGGIDGVEADELGDVLDVYDIADYILPLTEKHGINKFLPDKNIGLPLGTNILHANEFHHLEKFRTKTALLFHVLYPYGNFFKSIEILLKHGYRVVTTTLMGKMTPQDIMELQGYIDLLFGAGNVVIRGDTTQREHSELIAQSHIGLSLYPLERSFTATPIFASLGIPCITLDISYYQEIFYPDVLPETVDDIDKILGDTELLESSGRKAKELAWKYSVTNPEYRNMVVNKFEEIANN